MKKLFTLFLLSCAISIHAQNQTPGSKIESKSSVTTPGNKQYTENLKVQLDGETVAEQKATIDVKLSESGEMDLVLKNFYFSLEGEPMYVGNIYVDNIQTKSENKFSSFKAQQKATVTNGDDPADADWIGEFMFKDGLDIDMAGKFTDDRFYCTIDLTFGPLTIHVIFGDEGLNISTPTFAGANQTVNVYTLQGTAVKTNVKKSNALDGLTKGIYLVGGKKILKK